MHNATTGTFRKSAGTATLEIGVPFDNDGTVEVPRPESCGPVLRTPRARALLSTSTSVDSRSWDGLHPARRHRVGLALGGTLRITTESGFTPVLGQTFRIVNAASQTGQFGTVIGANIPGGLQYSVQYDATGTFLVVGPGPPTGGLEVRKVLSPTGDPGRFDLLIRQGTTTLDIATGVGDGGTTGRNALEAGTYEVSESAAPGTSLTNYTSSIECLANGGTGGVVASTTGNGPLNVTLAAGDDIVCTITNTRTGDGQNFPISIGDTVSPNVPGPGAGNLETPGVADVYTFTASAGQSVFFDRLTGFGVVNRVNWTLQGPNGQVFTGRFGQVDGVGPLTLPDAGTYVLTVQADSGASDTGTYSFTLFDVPAPQNFPISIGDTVSPNVARPRRRQPRDPRRRGRLHLHRERRPERLLRPPDRVRRGESRELDAPRPERPGLHRTLRPG